MLCTCFSTVPLERIVDAPRGNQLLNERGVDDRCALETDLFTDTEEETYIAMIRFCFH